MGQSGILSAIESCYLFSSLSPEDLSGLAQSASVSRYAKGRQIFSMGDPADGLRIVQQGLVRVWTADPNGHELTLVLLEDGDSFGEIALFDDLPRTAHATALEETVCVYVPRAAADRLLDSDPSFARHVIEVLCETLRRNTDAIGSFAFQSLDARLAQKLHDLAIAHAKVSDGVATFSRKFSQNDLARMLGVTREAVNKRLGKLTAEGIVTTESGYWVVLDMAALAQKAQRA